MTDNQRRAEQYLGTIRNKVQEYKLMRNEIDALEYAASGMGAIRYDKEHVDGSSGKDRLVEFVSDALEKRAIAEALLYEIDDLKMNCYRTIKRIKNTDERIVLEWYYINARPMQEIMRKISVSQRKAYYIKDDALEHFGELLNR